MCYLNTIKYAKKDIIKVRINHYKINESYSIQYYETLKKPEKTESCLKIIIKNKIKKSQLNIDLVITSLWTFDMPKYTCMSRVRERERGAKTKVYVKIWWEMSSLFGIQLMGGAPMAPHLSPSPLIFLSPGSPSLLTLCPVSFSSFTGRAS